MPKDFKTIDEQLEILKSRNLTVSDENKAKDFLLQNNYYRISGYSLTLRNHDRFYDDATFQNIIDIYNFDSELRNVLLRYIEIIEVEFKAVYSYYFSKEYGGFGYKDSKNFTDLSEHMKIISRVNEQIIKDKEKEAFIKHHIDELQEDLPMWALVELFSISEVSKLYKISIPEIQKQMVDFYKLNLRHGADILEKYMHGITILRNLCAHNRRLFNRLFVTKPTLSSKEKKLLNIKGEKRDNDHLFGYVIVMKHLLSEDNFNLLKDDILRLKNKYPFVDLKYYGFCPDWENRI